MCDSIITRRRTTSARRQPSQLRHGLADSIIPGARTAWRSFWQHIEHPRLVGGAVLFFPTLALTFRS